MVFWCFLLHFLCTFQWYITIKVFLNGNPFPVCKIYRNLNFGCVRGLKCCYLVSSQFMPSFMLSPLIVQNFHQFPHYYYKGKNIQILVLLFSAEKISILYKCNSLTLLRLGFLGLRTTGGGGGGADSAPLP